MSPSDSTLIRIANVSSWSGLGLGVVLLVVVTVIQVTATQIDPHSEILGGVLDNLTAATLAVLILGSLTVQMSVRVVRYQRRLARGQRELLEAIQFAAAERRRSLVVAHGHIIGRASVPVHREADTVPIAMPDEKVIDLGGRIAKKINDR